MVQIASFTLLLGLFGLLMCLFQQWKLTWIRKMFAVLLMVAFVAQIGSIYINIETRCKSSDFDPLHKDLKYYGTDDSITSDWDELQSNLNCCGAKGNEVIAK